MGVAGYLASIRISGTATSMTSEAMSTNSTVANTYQINSSVRQIWDRQTVPTFTEGSTGSSRPAIPAAQVQSIDYLFGTVTFTVAQTTPIRVSGNYLPTSIVAGAHSYTLNQSQELLDDTDFQSTGLVSRIKGLKDINITLSRYDSTATLVDLFTLVSNGNEAVVEIRPGGDTTNVFRSYTVVESDNHSGDAASIEGSDVTFQLDADDREAFGWGALV
jgi:hypothetical protein